MSHPLSISKGTSNGDCFDRAMVEKLGEPSGETFPLMPRVNPEFCVGTVSNIKLH
uniref:Uncharacterized protein n=1 Tax=Triticum urartu TaxID=4572 RepID=A0A8R7P4Q8_TRIUA